MRSRDRHPPMDLFRLPDAPEGVQVAIMLEECGLPFEARLLTQARLQAGADELPDFIDIDRLPALVDHATGVHLFHAGAILHYLAEKTGRFMPVDPDGRYAVLQWLFWEASRLAPAAERVLRESAGSAPPAGEYAYSFDRPRLEYQRVCDVMERALTANPCLAGDYSIADMAAWPWIARCRPFESSAGRRYQALQRWFNSVGQRSGVRRGSRET